METGERTIAVLTFTNVTGDAADDWIGTGIAETVTADLKNVRDVTVIGRAQVFEQFKNVNAETGRNSTAWRSKSDDGSGRGGSCRGRISGSASGYASPRSWSRC